MLCVCDTRYRVYGVRYMQYIIIIGMCGRGIGPTERLSTRLMTAGDPRRRDVCSRGIILCNEANVIRVQCRW